MNGVISLFELHKDCSHIVSTVRISVVRSRVQVLIKKLFETITAVCLLEAVDKIFGKLGSLVLILLPNTVTANNQHFLFACPLDLDDVRHAGDGLLVEG